MPTLSNVAKEMGDNQSPACIGLTTSGLPSKTEDGVSTLCVPQWYVLRVAYGKEAIANKFLQDNGIETYYPTHTTRKRVGEMCKKVTESYIPNIFFARASYEDLKDFVYDNVHKETKHLRFYYAHYQDGTMERLTVPEWQMQKLRIVCGSESDNVLIRLGEIEKFKEGVHVRVMEGAFEGFEGIVARYHGQQRVGITIKGLLTVATAYVPAAFLRILK